MSAETARWWVAAIPAALTFAVLSYPLLLASGAVLGALGVHGFFSHICHQIPDRSFHLMGVPLAACARCIGIYAGAAVGAFVLARREVILKVLLVVLALNLLEAVSEYLGLHGNWLTFRAVLGFAAGASLAALVSQAAAEARSFHLKEAR